MSTLDLKQVNIANLTNTAMSSLTCDDNGKVLMDGEEVSTEFLAGVGRTWQDVGSSRSVEVTYTNNTGRDIEVRCWVLNSDTIGKRVTVGIDGAVHLSTQSIGDETNSEPFHSFSFTVPNESTYGVFRAGSGNISIGFWWELR